MCASSSGRAAPFFLASATVLLQQVADSKINVRSACTLITRYIENLKPHVLTVFHQLFLFM